MHHRTMIRVLESASLAIGQVTKKNDTSDNAHTYNVVFYTAELPTEQMIDAINGIIQFGIDKGHIQANYTLLGHRQVRETECPGDRFFNEIKSWKHFVNLPVVASSAKTTIS